MSRAALWGLLAVVAGAAAVLSFSALRDLALLCGFSAWLAPLLPVVIDAGAGAGSLVWLGGWSPAPARRFARALALVLLTASVAGNALGHGLAAYSARPAWWVVVLVSAVAPAVLGAVVHLAVLATRERTTERPERTAAGPAAPARHVGTPDTDADLLAELAEDAFWSGPVDHPGPVPDQTAVKVPDQSASDEVLAADLREWADQQPDRPSRNAVMSRYSIGATRASRLLEELARSAEVDHPGPGPDQTDREADR